MLNKRSYVEWQFLRSKENLRQEEKNYLWNIFINKIMVIEEKEFLSP